MRTAPRYGIILAGRLASGPRVLKQARGNGGLGVWKVELATPTPLPGATSMVHVQHAHEGATATVPLAAFLDGFGAYFESGGRVVEQPFLPRGAEGMVRCYLAGTVVAGFSEHLPRGFLRPRPFPESTSGAAPGLEKVMQGPDAPAFRALRAALESDWLPGTLRLLGLDASALPAIWDADFLRGDRLPTGDDTWVLCEINASCVSPFPDEAADMIAETAVSRIAARSRDRKGNGAEGI